MVFVCKLDSRVDFGGDRTGSGPGGDIEHSSGPGTMNMLDLPVGNAHMTNRVKKN